MDDRSVLFLWNADSPEAKFYSEYQQLPNVHLCEVAKSSLQVLNIPNQDSE